MRLSSIKGRSSPPLLEETIGQNLERSVERAPRNRALVSRAQSFSATYAELWELTTQAARALIARGIGRQDRIGIWSPNRYEWVVLQYATARIGAVLVNINPAYKTSELAYVLQKSGVRLLFHSRSFRQSDYVAMVNEVEGECPHLEAKLFKRSQIRRSCFAGLERGFGWGTSVSDMPSQRFSGPKFKSVLVGNPDGWEMVPHLPLDAERLFPPPAVAAGSGTSGDPRWLGGQLPMGGSLRSSWYLPTDGVFARETQNIGASPDAR